MIILQNSNLPLSTDFLIKKGPYFCKTLTFKDLNGTLFLQNADFHTVKITFEDLNGTLFWLEWRDRVSRPAYLAGRGGILEKSNPRPG